MRRPGSGLRRIGLESMLMTPKPIRRIGAYLVADEDGYLPSPAGTAIAAPWSAAVESLVAAYLAEWGQDLHSIYVRGSVARGLALVGVSDLDSFAFQARYFRHHLDTFLHEYPAEPDEGKPGFVAWLAKRFLRLGMELVMVEEGRYTSDLYLCYASFAKHYPARGGQMRRALELAVNPVADRASEAFLREFGAWLAVEAERFRRASHQ